MEATHKYPQTKTPLIWILRAVFICSCQSIGRGKTSIMMSMMRFGKPLPNQRCLKLRHVPGSVKFHTFSIGLQIKVTLKIVPMSHATFMACTDHRAYLNLELLRVNTRV